MLQPATTHLTNASAGLRSSQDGASRESSQRIVHNGQPVSGSFVARQTASQSSNVDGTVANDASFSPPSVPFFRRCEAAVDEGFLYIQNTSALQFEGKSF